MFDSPFAILPERRRRADMMLRSFLRASNGKTIYGKPRKMKGDIVIFGLWKPQLFNMAPNFWYIDNGYFLPSRPPSKMKGYYRIIRDSWYSNGLGPANKERFDSYNIQLDDWKGGGSDIVLVPPTKYAAPVIGENNPKQWVSRTTKKIQQYSDRPIRISTKKDPMDWNSSIHCIVCCMSNVQVEALIKGIPVITTRFTNIGSIEEIENPPGEEAREVLFSLANQQWNMQEIREGKAWADLNEYPY